MLFMISLWFSSLGYILLPLPQLDVLEAVGHGGVVADSAPGACWVLGHEKTCFYLSENHGITRDQGGLGQSLNER